MKKKIGIVTWYKNGNYGGSLQAYALAKIISQMGYEVEFIDYNEGAHNKLLYWLYRKIRLTGALVLFPKMYVSKIKIFKFVQNFLNESPRITRWDELIEYSKKYDAVVCGSDQIWNSFNGVIKYYFLDFAQPEKRVAYAPSIGINNIKEEYLNEFRKAIEGIEFLSIREQRGAQIIKQSCNKDALVVLDPVLLIPVEEWQLLAKQSCLPKGDNDYIFCYFLTKDKRKIKFVETLSEITKLPIKFVTCKRIHWKRFSQIGASVEEFLGLINNSTYFVTDSFHGACFGALFKKKVGVFYRFENQDPINQNSRIDNLISTLGIPSIIIDDYSNVEKFLEAKTDYNLVDDRLKSLRYESIAYLQHSLTSVCNFLSHEDSHEL